MKEKDVLTARRQIPPPTTEVVIESPHPIVDGGRFAVKGIVGDPIEVSADVFSHGHGLVRALARIRRVGARRWDESPMAPLGNDRFAGLAVPRAEGPFEIEIAASPDELATWANDARRRLEAARMDAFDPEIGGDLLEEAASCLLEAGLHAGSRTIMDLASAVRTGLRLEVLDAIGANAQLLSQRAIAGEGAATVRLKGFASRERAAFSSWYELFPRSASPDPSRPGTLRDVIGRLDYVSELGFDVLYLPPVHPIGVTARKGPDNSTASSPGDVGSPWAIGSRRGGHCAVAPELGTIEDFDALVKAAKTRGIEVALDLAFQCSPDHPWVSEHPQWFRHRRDGSIACAENPPKRYEDIYPIDFHTSDREALWQALAGVVSYWISHGVRIFRVDNPHTKPFAFWEWMIAEMKREAPGVLFLAEAFTRPRVMHRLAKVGFDQSYTYFTWRNEKWEIEQYFIELSSPPGNRYFRPNVWPNTPDILARSLQHGGRASFVGRLVLAAGLSASYGIYGPVFELMWDEPVARGSEEYRKSEKYEVHHHDLSDPSSLADVIARINEARRISPALQRNEGVFFHSVDNEHLIAWSKLSRGGDGILGVVNLDWRFPQSGFVDVDVEAIGLAGAERFAVRDVLSGERYIWSAGRNFVKLDPAVLSAHLFLLEGEP